MKDQANPLVNNYLQAISKNGITPFPQAIELLDFYPLIWVGAPLKKSLLSSPIWVSFPKVSTQGEVEFKPRQKS